MVEIGHKMLRLDILSVKYFVQCLLVYIVVKTGFSF